MRPISRLPEVLSRVVPALVLVLSLFTIVTIVSLERRATTNRDAEAQLLRVDAALTRLQGDPFAGMHVIGGTTGAAYAAVGADERQIERAVARLDGPGAPPALRALRQPLQSNFAAIARLLPIATAKTFTTRADARLFPALKTSTETAAQVQRLLATAGREYRARAQRTQTQATAGSATMILLLFAGFALLYRRAFRARRVAERLAAENAALAAAAKDEARTDALTGLGNRRALTDDLAGEFDPASDERGILLALFDLDGFKHYNDTFGHPAGDGLLTRLAVRLHDAVAGVGVGNAYRMGGDEFCVLTRAGGHEQAKLVRLAADSPLRGRRRIPRQLLLRLRADSAGRAVGGSRPAAGRPPHVRAEGRMGVGEPPEQRCAAEGAQRTQRRTRRAHQQRRRPGHERRRASSGFPRTRSTGSASPPSCTTSARRRSRTRSFTSPARSTTPSGSSCASTP